MDNKFNIGSVVLSKAGHDKNGLFVVIKVCDNDYVLIADGKTRKLDKPKRKKIKHLKPIGVELEEIAIKLSANAEVYDKHIRAALAECIK